MKRIALIMCVCLMSIVANAQKVQFGVRGGLNTQVSDLDFKPFEHTL